MKYKITFEYHSKSKIRKYWAITEINGKRTVFSGTNFEEAKEKLIATLKSQAEPLPMEIEI